MLRKMLLALPILLLTSCAGTGVITPDQLDQIVAQVQAYTAKACLFVPTAATVANIVGAFVPQAAIAGSVVSMVGDAICTAPITASVRRRGTTLITKTVRTPRGAMTVKGHAIVGTTR